MKKISLLLLLLFGAMATFVAFQACSSDEMNEQPQTKAQLLLKKSREFAKKYGVKMELNEENIEEIAKTLTVEEMEQDYRNWAEDTREPIKMTLTNSNTSKNKIKLRKKISEREVSGSGNEFTCYASFGQRGNIYEATVLVKWEYRSPTNNRVTASINAYSTTDWHKGSTDVDLHPVFSMANDKLSFSAHGTARIYGITYTKQISVNIYYNEAHNIQSVSLD